MSADQGQLRRSSTNWLTASRPSTASLRDEAAIGATTRYPDVGPTEVLLSPLLGNTFDEALRAAGAPA